jgi:tryptophan-rich hypothetical protein
LFGLQNEKAFAMRKRRTRVSEKHIVGSKWTSVAPIEGWVHFHVITWVPSSQKVELRSSCKPDMQFWELKSNLENSEHWLQGWK